MTDGPFAETKEFLGGFTLIDARDLDEALQIAAKFPSAAIGSMEVRPLLEPAEASSRPLDRKFSRQSFGTSRALTRLCPRKKWCRSPNPIGRRNNEIPVHGLLRAESARQAFQARI